MMCPRYSTANALAKAKALCRFQSILWLRMPAARAGARHPVAGHEDRVPDRLEPVRRQGGDMAVIASGGTDWMARIAANGGSEVLVKSQKMSLTQLYCLRNSAGQAIE
jgi:hypothetical protein